eukprot:TRINITY_DN2921_c0_g1_i1.p1 TRINITY_DN2921_c0_g1~~TRINITY_DN2921_c0_g1_i1.p1  ORF type:complete len:299 (+),score=65.94 TRINITY_DN2921_c0_g1_i1:221-1117(+)
MSGNSGTFNIVAATPTRFIKMVLGVLALLALMEHRRLIRSLVLRLLQRLGLRSSRKPIANADSPEEPQDEFSAASAHARTDAFKGAVNPTYEQQAQIYGLFKQAVAGPVNIEEPSKLYMMEHGKWKAWAANRHMSKDEASEAYVQLISALHPGWQSNAGAARGEHAAAKPTQGGMGVAPSAMAHVEVQEGEQDICVWAGEGNADKVRQCLAAGASPDSADPDTGLTSLHLAADRGNLEMVQLLLDSKCDVNAVDNDGETALHTSTYEGHHSVSRALVAGGADANAENHDGEKPGSIPE